MLMHENEIIAMIVRRYALLIGEPSVSPIGINILAANLVMYAYPKLEKSFYQLRFTHIAGNGSTR